MSKPTILDIETYPNYTLYAFKKGEKVKKFSLYGEDKVWGKKEIKKITKLLTNNLIITFNGMNYDIPMVDYGLRCSPTVADMYQMSLNIIKKRMRSWAVYKKIRIEPMNINHIDIIEPSPAVAISLKLYGARMGTRKLQDLPYNPELPLTKKQAKKIDKYCENDLIVTEELYYAIKPRLDLREKIGARVGVDLRSKSDAQIAEALLVKAVGYKGKAPHLSSDYTVTYKPPKYIKFKTKMLQDVFKMCDGMEFKMDKGGKPSMPPALTKTKIVIGKTSYKLGMGGLHSNEKAIVIDDDMENADITSMYPSLIENQRLYPAHLGKGFLKEYSSIKIERIKAKNKMKTLEKGTKDYQDLDDLQGGFKIQLNGSYGKFGSKYSKLYSPDLLLQTTMTGQLTLLMLIEELELEGISVISANTDGLEAHCPTKKDKKKFRKITEKHGVNANLGWEFGSYKGLFARDVNNYVAKYKDEVKAKGVYAPRPKHPNKGGWLDLNVQVDICFTAVRQFIFDGTPIKDTIDECKDVTQFLSASTVNGGAYFGTPIFGESVPVVGTTGKTRMVKVVKDWEKGSRYLGKVVRFYYSKNGGSIHNKTNGNLVSMTSDGNGVRPMMDLMDELPEDLDYQFYYDYANRMLKELGYES